MSEKEQSEIRIQECKEGLSDLFDRLFTKHGTNFTTAEWHTATNFVAKILLEYELKIQYGEVEEPAYLEKPD